MLDKEAVNVCADIIGHDKKPKDYIRWVKNNLNMDISNATVTKTLGRYSERENTVIDNSLLLKAQDLLLSCNSNIYYSKSLLERARGSMIGSGGGNYV